MAAKTKIICGLITLLIAAPACAENIDMNMAQMQAMDKITGRVSLIEVPVGGELKFGTFSVVVRSCITRSEEEIPENTAFVDVTDKSFDKEEFNIFKGWMFSSSPAVNAVEHPIYDVWLIKCFNGEPKPEQLLTEEQLAARDNLPTLREIRNSLGKTNEESSNTTETIRFKDSMYKTDNPEHQKLPAKQEARNGPQNLLNIKNDYKIPEEETVIVPADELSEALDTEAKILEQQNPTDKNVGTEEEDTAKKDNLPIDDALAAAIEAELSGHISE